MVMKHAMFPAAGGGNYYYNHFTGLWILSGTTLVSRYQKDKTKPIWISWSNRQ